MSICLTGSISGKNIILPNFFQGLKMSGGTAFGNLFPAKKKLEGVLKDGKYTHHVGNSYYSISIPASFSGDTTYLKIGELVEIKPADQFAAYVSFGPAAFRHEQYCLAIVKLESPIQSEQSFPIGQNVINSFRQQIESKLRTEIISTKKEIVDRKETFFCSFRILESHNTLAYRVLFYHISLTPYYHVSFFEVKPEQDISDINQTNKEFSDWISTFTYFNENHL